MKATGVHAVEPSAKACASGLQTSAPAGSGQDEATDSTTGTEAALPTIVTRTQSGCGFVHPHAESVSSVPSALKDHPEAQSHSASQATTTVHLQRETARETWHGSACGCP